MSSRSSAVLAVESPATAQDDVLQMCIRRVEEAIRKRAPLRSALSLLTHAVEEMSGHTVVASILVLDGQSLLRNGASPRLPADYLRAIDGIAPHPDVGTCAAAAARAVNVYTPDFTEDSCWAELRHLPMALGFLGAWSCPIKSAKTGKVLGTFGTYFREKRLPTAREIEIVEALVPVAARVIEAGLSKAS